MDIAATAGAAVIITATLPRTTGVPDTTDGPTIRGPYRSLMDGVGAERRGLASMADGLRLIPCMRVPRSG